MIETCLISGEVKMELSGAERAINIAEDAYIEFNITPYEELDAIESSINDVLENGGDVLPLIYLLNSCRNFAESDNLEEYSEACIYLYDIFRRMPGNHGGRLKPVDDYLDFCIE